jgi:C1A family cysteine protease
MNTHPVGEATGALAGAPDVIDHTCDLLPVRDQGRRGTCLAFAATAVHEHARRLRRGTASSELSVELLFWRCKQLDGAPGRDGTIFTAARDALGDPGQCAETLWPYDPTRSHANGYAPPPAATQPEQLRRSTSGVLPATVDSATAALRKGTTVLVGIELWDAFYECRTSWLQAPDRDIDGARHAVCLVGVDDARSLIKLRNSWGTRWGDGGYAWLGATALAAVLIEVWTITDDIDPR